MAEKADIAYVTSFRLESGVHPKYKTTIILPRSAGAAGSTPAFISLPVLEYGKDCPAGTADQRARCEDSPALELPPAHLPIPRHCCLQGTAETHKADVSNLILSHRLF